MSDKTHTYEGSGVIFDHKQPRPPVPGEERTHSISDWGTSAYMEHKHKSSSPTPRKYYSFPNDSAAPYGYEPEGSCRSSLPMSSKHESARLPYEFPSPPACIKWAQSLRSLLQDSDGVKLFLQYLESEGQMYADALHFWFACEGLRKQHEKEKIQQLVKLIYRKFLVKSALPINDDLRKNIVKNMKSSHCLEPPVTLFDEAQTQLEQLINNTTYPNFLESDIYLQYLQSVQNPSNGSGDFSSESSSSSSTVSNKDLGNLASGVGPLPTLHEDVEFVVTSSAPLVHTPGTSFSTGYHTPNMPQPVRLTRDLLLMSQKHRAADVRPKTEAYAGLFMYRNTGSHAAYNSYNPVSRQDSEMQSLSSHSDARTESDNMSLTDSSIDGRGIEKSLKRRAAIVEARYAKESAAINRETHLHQTFIPRTQKLQTRQCQPMDPEKFAAILMGKLEIVKKEQETQELLDLKLKESDSLSSLDDKLRMSDIQSRALANAIREKLQLEDDNVQDILDQHVSRVFSDLTPSRSPGIISPRPHSPPRNRYSHNRSKRRDKDGFSTFSGDSGNVHDFTEGSEHRMAMVKSKSMPEYAEERFCRGSASRRSSSRKALADLTDSGVSVVSDTPPVVPLQQERVLAWLMESEEPDKRGGTLYTRSEMSMKPRGTHRASATSPNAVRHRTKERSSSLERNVAGTSLGPAQPFVADPSMPPPPLPNTTIQLEEARRRLMDDEFRSKPRQKFSNKYYPDTTQSSQSTLRKSIRGMRTPMQPSQLNEETTTVVFSFCDEQFPYRTKIPGTHVTLRQFKDYLPKKGNYRFFFKTVCEELGNQVIQEEVSNDADVLPLWEGKIMAQVKPID